LEREMGPQDYRPTGFYVDKSKTIHVSTDQRALLMILAMFFAESP